MFILSHTAGGGGEGHGPKFLKKLPSEERTFLKFK